MIRALLLIFLPLSIAFAEYQESQALQDSLYKEALNAEEEGDLVLAIELFSKAYETGGIYSEELGEILNDYALALEEKKKWFFEIEFLGKTDFYKEKSDFYSHSEFLGNLTFKAQALREFETGKFQTFLGPRFTGNLFFLPKNTYLDTSKFYCLPELAFGFYNQSFFLNAALGGEWRKDDFNPMIKVNLEKELWKKSSHKISTILESNFLSENFIRSEWMIVHHYQGKSPYSHFLGGGIRSHVDSVYQTQIVYFITQDTLPLQFPEPPRDTLFYDEKFPPAETPSEEPPPILPIEAYALKGNFGHLLGPQFFYRGFLNFKPWELEFSALLFLGNESYLKNSRNLLDLDLSMNISLEAFGFRYYIGSGFFFRNYFYRAESYQMTLPKKRYFVNLFLGIKKEF